MVLSKNPKNFRRFARLLRRVTLWEKSERAFWRLFKADLLREGQRPDRRSAAQAFNLSFFVVESQHQSGSVRVKNVKAFD